MPCRVGITTDPDTRKASWENKVYGLTNWRILATYRSREKAQEHETRYAERYDCQASPGGAEAGGCWYVYRFDYTRTK
jgi:hypothetical protein